ncbi:MAG: DNA polymerase Y family protein [Dinoroseobacter sp.]|nr:DNA polymerase Y family protein [Dinoroseobacter sp.]
MPAPRRIMSLWFPRLGAERCLRMAGGPVLSPFATVQETGNQRLLGAVSAEASAAGLHPGQPLRDARAMCPSLQTSPADPEGEAAFLRLLRRWAGKFSPWVSEEAPDGLIVDLTGCAHLFGGEPSLVARVEADCASLGLTVRIGLADTVGAAWAIARYTGQHARPARSGDEIDQEARATRSRAGRRHWTKGGAAPVAPVAAQQGVQIAPAGQTRRGIAALPVAALRLDADTCAALGRVGLRRIEDLWGMPRAALARRFGLSVTKRLDQALGVAPEPVSPARPPNVFALRISFPDPIGLPEDIEAGLDRLLPRLAEKLRDSGRGARRLRWELLRADQTRQVFEVGLARPSDDPMRMRPLLLQKLAQVEPGYGIDILRLEAVQTEPLAPQTHKGHMEAADQVASRLKGNTALDDLVGTLGARVGLEAITRWHPADTHIPEKTATVLAAAWSDPHEGMWPHGQSRRPLTLCSPEPVQAPDGPMLPARFRWRGMDHDLKVASGPERIAPEWWLDDPIWRSGVRDYWRVETRTGLRLWLYYAHGGLRSSGWFCHGQFD